MTDTQKVESFKGELNKGTNLALLNTRRDYGAKLFFKNLGVKIATKLRFGESAHQLLFGRETRGAKFIKEMSKAKEPSQDKAQRKKQKI